MNSQKLPLERSIDVVQRKMKGFTLNNRNTTVYLLGLTGSGKSTVVNYLLGAKDKLKFVKKMGQF